MSDQPVIHPAMPDGTDALYGQIREVLAQARQQTWRNVNQVMVQAYWQVGRLIVEHEQAGQARAAYGAQVLARLAERLTAELGRGFSLANLRNFRQFHLTFTLDEIRYTPCSELSWSHFRRLMRVADPKARAWYAAEAVSQTWSHAALDRQISTLHYERLLSSQDRAGVQAEAAALIRRNMPPDPRDFIRDPYVLDFLDATPGAALYEQDVEQGLLDNLQKFLLELGKLSHQDVGQLDMYVRVFDERERGTGDNPTIGLILCSERNAAVARYSRLADGDQLFASRYQAYLPTEAQLQAELARERALIGDGPKEAGA